MFGYLLDALGTKAVLDRDDRTGKWKMKAAKERKTTRSDPKFKMAEDEERLFAFLAENRNRPKQDICNNSNGLRRHAARFISPE